MKRHEIDDLDRLLSSRLKKAIGEDGQADWHDVSVRSGTSRTVWHWSRRRVLLVAGVLVLAVSAAGASNSLIPWVNEEAKPDPPTLGEALPLRAQIVTDGTGNPLILKKGEVFHYQVALTNMSARSFHFGDCPNYAEVAWREGDTNLPPFGFDIYVLNCRSVRALDPGETVTFAMNLRVSEDAWDGAKGELEWILAPYSESPPTARAAFVIGDKPSSYSPSDVYGAFAPGTPEATLPPDVELDVEWSYLMPSGRFVPGSRRILIEGSGELDATVYAWATESGKVCYRVGDRESCDGGATQTGPIAWDTYFTQDNPNSIVVSYIVGLARDGVKKIDVMTTDGERLHAVFENNAFYAKASSGRAIIAVVATMADGSEMKFSTIR